MTMNHIKQISLPKSLFAFSLLLAFLPGVLHGQVTPGPTSQTTTVSGTTLYFGNGVGNRTSLYQTVPGSMTATFEEQFAGAPATVSIVIQGCMRGGTCDSLDTYTTVANANRSPALTKVYDYFAVTPSWTGGTSVSVQVNYSTALAGGSSGGSGTITGVTAGNGLNGGGTSGGVTLNVGGTLPSGTSLSPANLGQSASNQFWLAPAMPTFTGSDSASGGSLNCLAPHYMQIVFNNALGSTLPALEELNSNSTYFSPHNCTSGSTGSITINPITAPSGYTSWTLYEGTGSGGEQIVAACTNITSGSGCTFGVDGSGSAPPTINTAIITPPGLTATECPPGILPSMFEPDNTAGIYHTWLGVDPYSNNGRTNGTPVFCHSTRFNDMKQEPTFGNNAFVLVDHMFGTNTSTSNQDRSLWVGAATVTGDTGSHYALEGIQSELDINSGSGFSITGSVSGEISDGSFNVTDNATANYTLAGSTMGVNSVRGSIFKNGAGANSSLDPNYQVFSAWFSAVNPTFPAGSVAASVNSVSVGAAPNLNFSGFLHTYNANPLAYQVAFATRATVTPGGSNNYFLVNGVPTLPSMLNGPVSLSEIDTNTVASLSVKASMNTSGSQTVSQPTITAPNSVSCSGGASTYGYEFVGVDGNGGTVTSTQTQCTTGVNPLTSGNPATVNAAGFVGMNVASFVRIDVYRTAGPMATGKIGSLTCTTPTAVATIVCSAFSDTGLSATTAVPTVNTTGTLTAAGMERDANSCRITADVSLTVNTPNSFCSWNLPPVAQGWSFECDVLWALTAGTGTNNFALGVNASQAPTGTTNALATIYTTTSNTATNGSAAISASGATNVLTGATYTPAATVLPSRITGTLLASATPGTFAVTAAANGTTATAAVKAGTMCRIY